MEIYAVDIDPARGLVAHGGSNDCVEIYSYREDYPIGTVGGYSESILCVKFLPCGQLLVVAVDGTVSLLDGTSEIATASVDGDVSVARFNGKLLIGTEQGRVYVYDEELNPLVTCAGHSSPVTAVDYCGGRIYSLSEHCFIVHDSYGNIIHTFRASNASAFCHISGEVFCLARDNRVQVFKDTRKLFEMSLEGPADAILLLGKSLVIGGAFGQLLLIDTAHHYAVCRLDIGVEILESEKLGANEVIFSTTCGCMGTVDIRDAKTLKIYEANVGTIYTFKAHLPCVVFGGEEGAGILNLETRKVQKLDVSSAMD